MYIPEFWCGVAATIVTEFLILTITTIINNKKQNKR